MNPLPFVTIAVPTLNERGHIRAVLEELLASTEGFPHEIVVADGGSTDGTTHVVRSFAESNPSVRLVGNPLRIQSAGVNLVAGIADPRSEILIKADAHCAYPKDFVAKLVSAMVANKAQSVVVPMFTVAEGDGFQAAVARAQNSLFGNGGSAHRDSSGQSGWVDHGHHAAFDLPFFKSIGGYDETFAVNEDAEYDMRVHKAGGRVWMARGAEINYFPRKSPGQLARQYFRYGFGRAKMAVKHSARPRARQLAPLAIFVSNALSVAGVPFCGLRSLAPLVGYAALCGIYAAVISKGDGRHAYRKADVAIAFSIMHNVWGAGFVTGLFRR